MAMSLEPDEGEEEGLLAAINTTPLVDIMLVLLIIFLITIPVVTQTVPVRLPQEVNQPTQSKPQNIVIAIDGAGDLFWNEARLADTAMLLEKLKQHALDEPRPEVHIRADRRLRYGIVGRVVTACQRAGIAKVAFILEPERGEP